MVQWTYIFIGSVALIVYDLLTLVLGGKFGYSSGNPAPGHEIAGLLGVIGIIISLAGYIISRRSISATNDQMAVQSPSWRMPVLFVVGMLAGWIPLCILLALLSPAPDGGGIGGAIFAIAGLTVAILANVILVVTTLFVPGFRKMIDGYLTTLILYGYVFLAYLMIGNYTWNRYIIPLSLWTAFAFLMFGFRLSIRRKIALITSGSIVVVGLLMFVLTLPNSYLLDEWWHARAKQFNKTEWCLHIAQENGRSECLMRVSGSAEDPSFCHLTREPETCLYNVFFDGANVEVCSVITDSQARQFCIQEWESLMMAKRAHRLADPSICQQPNNEQRSHCIWDAEEEAGRRPNCSALPDLTIRQKCFNAYPPS